ncbi:MAG TPA: hypothetical protein VJH95_05035, partial [Candidatus Nanoarchaeia archaeon]|nr:hypothetical protein [Candidatus Nanoarchaeia archaeon]
MKRGSCVCFAIAILLISIISVNADVVDFFAGDSSNDYGGMITGYSVFDTIWEFFNGLFGRGAVGYYVDSDGDGTYDFEDTDPDGDGVLDMLELGDWIDRDESFQFRDMLSHDADADGTPDYLDSSPSGGQESQAFEDQLIGQAPEYRDMFSSDSDSDGVLDYLDNDYLNKQSNAPSK